MHVGYTARFGSARPVPKKEIHPEEPVSPTEGPDPLLFTQRPEKTPPIETASTPKPNTGPDIKGLAIWLGLLSPLMVGIGHNFRQSDRLHESPAYQAQTNMVERHYDFQQELAAQRQREEHASVTLQDLSPRLQQSDPNLPAEAQAMVEQANLLRRRTMTQAHMQEVAQAVAELTPNQQVKAMLGALVESGVKIEDTRKLEAVLAQLEQDRPYQLGQGTQDRYSEAFALFADALKTAHPDQAPLLDQAKVEARQAFQSMDNAEKSYVDLVHQMSLLALGTIVGLPLTGLLSIGINALIDRRKKRPA